MTSNTVPFSLLRGHRLFTDLAHLLRMHSLLISPVPNLGMGGSGTLAKYKSLSGMLTATHVMAKYLDTKEIFSPIIATQDPALFFNDKVPIKGVVYLETPHGIELLRKQNQHWPEDTLDICFIHILVSTHDGCYSSVGFYRTTPLIHVMPSFDGTADLCIHQLGPTADTLPSSFGGASGAGMWQVRFEGDNGKLERIHELFFTGVLVAESPEALMSRGPDSLYNIFLRHLNTLI